MRPPRVAGAGGEHTSPRHHALPTLPCMRAGVFPICQGLAACASPTPGTSASPNALLALSINLPLGPRFEWTAGQPAAPGGLQPQLTSVTPIGSLLIMQVWTPPPPTPGADITLSSVSSTLLSVDASGYSQPFNDYEVASAPTPNPQLPSQLFVAVVQMLGGVVQTWVIEAGMDGSGNGPGLAATGRGFALPSNVGLVRGLQAQASSSSPLCTYVYVLADVAGWQGGQAGATVLFRYQLPSQLRGLPQMQYAIAVVPPENSRCVCVWWGGGLKGGEGCWLGAQNCRAWAR